MGARKDQTSQALVSLAPAPIIPKNVEEVMSLSQIYYKAGIHPKGANSPEKVAAVIMMGLEVGLSPAQSVTNIMIINNRMAIWGDAMLAIVQASGQLEEFDEEVNCQGEEMIATCKLKRKGGKEKIESFTMGEAKQADLLGKDPWKKFTRRMLKMRPRSWILRDNFADRLCGLVAAEEFDIAPEDSKVEVVKVETDISSSSPPPCKLVSREDEVLQVEAEEMITDVQQEKMKSHLLAFMTAKGVDFANEQLRKSKWSEFLSQWGVDKMAKLTKKQADEALAQIYEVTHSQEEKAVFG